ncbi:hypothetical protein J6590_060518 [Homalodisca vitripennis]|nr:hypothetical protein J6590_060518 [Homalodisca vitripennis]
MDCNWTILEPEKRMYGLKVISQENKLFSTGTTESGADTGTQIALWRTAARARRYLCRADPPVRPPAADTLGPAHSRLSAGREVPFGPDFPYSTLDFRKSQFRPYGSSTAYTDYRARHHWQRPLHLTNRHRFWPHRSNTAYTNYRARHHWQRPFHLTGHTSYGLHQLSCTTPLATIIPPDKPDIGLDRIVPVRLTPIIVHDITGNDHST